MCIVKRSIGRGLILGLALTLALSGQAKAGSPAPPSGKLTIAQAIGGKDRERKATTAPAPPIVLFENGLLTVKAENAHLLRLLEQIAAATGIGLTKNDRVWDYVTVNIEKQPLAAGVEALLKAAGNRRYATVYEKRGDQLKLVKVVLVNRGARDISTTSWPAGVGRDRVSVSRYLMNLLGTDVRVMVDERMRLPDFVSFYDPGASKRITRENIREYAETLFKKIGPILALDFSQLQFRSVREGNDSLGLGYDQVYQGVPVERAGVGLTVYLEPSGTAKPDMISAGGQFYPDIDLSTTPKVTSEEAASIAREDFEKNWKIVYPGAKSYVDIPDDEKRVMSAFQLLIHPVEAKYDAKGQAPGYDYYLCWKFQFDHMNYYVDAHDGTVIHRGSNIKTEIGGLAMTQIFGQEGSGTFVDTGALARDPQGNLVPDSRQKNFRLKVNYEQIPGANPETMGDCWADGEGF